MHLTHGGWATALLFLLVTLFLAGCATQPKGPGQPDGFTPLARDARVWHEATAVAYAEDVADLLDPAVNAVEALHGLPFVRPPRLFVCATQTCFKKMVSVPGYTAAVLPGEILVLSPRLDLEEHERLPGILAHELSHLHLGQRLGHYTATLPVWFHEGLASLVANGGGAEFSSDEDACNAWDSGRKIDFARLDSPAKRYQASDYKMSIHQFYRQAWRFLEYLQHRDPTGFTRMLRDIQAGKSFTTAVTDTYHTSLERLGLEFDFDNR